jgi:hypothetical protein
MGYDGSVTIASEGLKTASERTTSRNYTHPYRPWGIRLANAVLPLLSRLGLPPGMAKPLSSEELTRAARRRNSLEDFGDPGFRLPLDVLLDSINEESRLHPVGKFITRERLVNILGNRLRREYWFSRYPEILEEDVEAPLVITGLQRTGTTFLHRLLAEDPATLAVRSWEAINPVPYIDPESGGPLLGPEDKRRKFADTSQKALSYMAPDFFAVHPVETEEPEEDVLLLDFALLSTVPEATLRVPSYSRWLEGQDQLPAYRYMKDLLKLILWQRRRRRQIKDGEEGNSLKWRKPKIILKTPHHLEYLDALFTVFPKAKVIQTHRNPTVTLSSFCSMIAHGRGVFSDEVDPREIGLDWKRKVHRMISRAMETRDSGAWGEEKNRFFDIPFTRLINDPLTVVEEVRGFADIPFPEETKNRVRQAAKDHKPGKYGVHQYNAGDFGFSEEEVREEFASYIDRFDLSTSEERHA